MKLRRKFEIANATIEWAMVDMGLSDVDIKANKLRKQEDVLACASRDNIWMCKEIQAEDIVYTMLHEARHVFQFRNEGLRFIGQSLAMFHGEIYDLNTMSYCSFPWEIEADNYAFKNRKAVIDFFSYVWETEELSYG